MQSSTLLLRQVHPHFVRDGRLLTPAFRLRESDEKKLSVDDGDQIGADAAWFHFTTVLGYKSASVWAVTVAETAHMGLSAINEPLPERDNPRAGFAPARLPAWPSHSGINFGDLVPRDCESRAKMLASLAESRGSCYLAPSD